MAQNGVGAVDIGTGVFCNPPKQNERHHYRKSVSMGPTKLTRKEVHQLLTDMQQEWLGPDYDLLRKNCCHFADALCVKLGVGNVPKWVINLAGAGASMSDTLHGKKKEAPPDHEAIVAAAKAGDIHEKYRVNDGNDNCLSLKDCCGRRRKSEQNAALKSNSK